VYPRIATYVPVRLPERQVPERFAEPIKASVVAAAALLASPQHWINPAARAHSPQLGVLASSPRFSPEAPLRTAICPEAAKAWHDKMKFR